MRTLNILLISCLSIPAQAAFTVNFPLELTKNGQLPDGSIVFVGGTQPVTPATPEEGSCVFDISSDTMVAEFVEYGETVQINLHNGQRIINGVKGKSMNTDQNATYYELCLNGQQPIPFVPETEWADGECKYDSGLGFDQPRYWSDTYDGPSVKLFIAANLGSYEDNGTLSFGLPGMILPIGWEIIPPSIIQMSGNGSDKITYNGYQYFKGGLRNTRSDIEGGPIYYYEICRNKI